jgi:hypothetical protein
MGKTLGSLGRLGAVAAVAAFGLFVWNPLVSPRPITSEQTTLETTVELPGPSLNLAERQDLLNQRYAMPNDFDPTDQIGVTLIEIALNGTYNLETMGEYVDPKVADNVLTNYGW